MVLCLSFELYTTQYLCCNISRAIMTTDRYPKLRSCTVGNGGAVSSYLAWFAILSF